MASLSAEDGVSIDQAKAILQQNETLPSLAALQSAVECVLATTRLTGHRDLVSDPLLFSDILSLLLRLGTTSAALPLRLATWKCIGNLLADNDENREIFVARQGAVAAVKSGMVMGLAGGDAAFYEHAATVLKVGYNLCRDHEAAQMACLKEGMDRSIVQHIYATRFVSDFDTLDLALELLADLAEHLKEVSSGIDFDKAFISQVLRLPFADDVDPDTMDDMAAVLSPYMADARFQEAIMTTNQVPAAFELLDQTVLLYAPSPEQGKAFTSHLLQTISSISCLPDFPKSFSPTILPLLAPRAILSPSDPSVSPAVLASVLLGNYSTPISAPLIIAALDLPKLWDMLSLHAYGRAHTPGAADWLHAAAGGLRLLAHHEREKIADGGRCATTALALARYAHEDVQVAALRLLRAVRPTWADAEKVGKIWSGAGEKVKLELARTAVGMLRDANRPGLGEGTRWVLDAVCFAAAVEGVALANAEGMLGLVLLRQEDVAGRLAGDEGAVKAIERAVSAQGDELARKARDNALVLCAEMLRFQGLEEKVRTELERILATAGVTLAQREV